MDVDPRPRRPVGVAAIGERQIVEIARALSDEARCLILDEPTAALSPQEVERLFMFVRRLREQGAAIIYITHRLDEVHEIADRVQVLRDGASRAEGERPSFDRRDARRGDGRPGGRRACTGPSARRGSSARSPRSRCAAPPAARVRRRDLEVRPGEIVALYGKLGSGTARGRRGRVRPAPARPAGTSTVDGTRRAAEGPGDAIARGIGLLPADRKREATFMVRPVAENLAAPSWPRLARRGFISSRRSRRARTGAGTTSSTIRSRNDPGS